LAGAPPPPLPSLKPDRKSASARNLVAILLSLFLALFLADAVVSLADVTLILFFDVHFLSVIGGLLSFFAMLMALVIYGLMGLSPMIPKRWFLPLTLYYPACALVAVPSLIYFYSRLQPVAWGISLCQVILGLTILYCVRGGFKLSWPLVGEEQLKVRGFTWRNLSVFLLANVFVMLPAVIIYLVVCAGLAADHFTDGFLELRPGGLTVKVRKYVRDDGKTIQLFPMLHVADAAFYQRVSQSFPTNSIILMEGVTDSKNLLTNKITYKRMAAALGLGEQHQEFKPGRGQVVRADVDVDQFAASTISELNLITLLHAKGLNAETLPMLMQFAPPPQVGEQLWDDLLRNRNKHLLEEIQARLPQSQNIIVPWGAAHMPVIAKEIQKSGFRLEETREYVAIRFRYAGGKPKD
jgi:hypothetical protein